MRREAVANAADAVRDAQPRESTRHDVALGLRADRRVLAVKVERHAAIVELKAQIEAHARQRQRWRGSQLNTGVTIDPEAHAELRITNERLIAENSSLVAQVTEVRRINTILEADLAASRQAHAKDIANLVGAGTSVTALVARG